MLIHRAYRFELDLTNSQRTQFLRYAGVARWAYNYGLQRKTETYALGLKVPTTFEIMKEVTRLKATSHPWLWEVSNCVPNEALKDLDRAFTNFFDPNLPARHPVFKSRKNGVGGFRLRARDFRAKGRTVTLPRLGTVRTKHDIAIKGRILFATVKERAGRWFVIFCVEQKIAVTLNEGTPVGVDLGIKKLATISDGSDPVPNPNALGRNLKKLRRLQRSICRRQNGSNRRKEMKKKIATLHYRISCVRNDVLHQLTSRLAKNHGKIGIEDLNVAGMLMNGSLSRAIHDCGWGELRRQLEYKCKWYGSELVVFDRFYPSSKKCSACGNVKETQNLKERTYHCEKCGLSIDRDINAALNLRPSGRRLLDVDASALAAGKPAVKPRRRKRQPSIDGRKAVG